MELGLLNWIKDGKYRILVLKRLYNQSLLSSELATAFGVNRASMSRILKAMKETDLVATTTGSSRTVTYSITKKGRQLFEELNR